MPGGIISATGYMIRRSYMTTSTFRWFTWCFIRSNRLVDTAHCNSMLPRDMHKHIKWTSRMDWTPPIAIPTDSRNESPFSMTFTAPDSKCTMSKFSLSIGRTALPPAKSSFPLPIRLPSCALHHMRNLNSWVPKTAMKETIMTLRSRTSEH